VIALFRKLCADVNPQIKGGIVAFLQLVATADNKQSGTAHVYCGVSCTIRGRDRPVLTTLHNVGGVHCYLPLYFSYTAAVFNFDKP
jgi:hypothetical protein